MLCNLSAHLVLSRRNLAELVLLGHSHYRKHSLICGCQNMPHWLSVPLPPFAEWVTQTASWYGRQTTDFGSGPSNDRATRYTQV